MRRRQPVGGTYWQKRAQDVRTRIHQHECHDGCHGSGDELSHDGAPPAFQVMWPDYGARMNRS